MEREKVDENKGGDGAGIEERARRDESEYNEEGVMFICLRWVSTQVGRRLYV